MTCDAVVLAGGRAGEEMARRAGTSLRALFPYQGRPFTAWVYEALRASEQVARIAVIGPPELKDALPVRDGDRVLAEREGIEANLFGALDSLQPRDRVLITACDNPLLTTAAFDDFLRRAPLGASVAYPMLPHRAFLDRFPGATNIAVPLRDGAWIGGGCVLLDTTAIPQLERAIRAILAARKSKRRLLGILGWGFALRFALKRVTVPELERRAGDILGVPVRLVHDCDPAFAIDIDDPEDWDYMMAWAAARHSGGS